MATIDPPHLRWQLDEHYKGETLRVAFQIPGVASQSVTGLDFALELESSSTVRVVASLVGSVSAGQNGVQLIADPTALMPPLPAGITTFEAVVESATLPSGWFRCQGVMSWAYGTRTVTAGRLHLRESALS